MNTRSCFAILIVLSLSACGGAGGGGDPATSVALQLPPVPTLLPEPPAPPSDVMLTSVSRPAGTTEVIPGQCFDADGFTFAWNALSRPSLEQLPYAFTGTAKLSSFTNVSLVTATSDVAEEAAYRVLTDEQSAVMTIDFTAGSWYPRDFGRESVKYYLTGCISPASPQGTTFSLTRNTPQLHEHGMTADAGASGWQFTVKKDPAVALPRITAVSRTVGIPRYATTVVGSITASCTAADKVPYCILSRIPFRTKGVSIQSIGIDGASYYAQNFCGQDCQAAYVGRVVMPGQSVTIYVVGMPYEKEYSIDFSGMTWAVDRYTVIPDASGVPSTSLDGTAVESWKG